MENEQKELMEIIDGLIESSESLSDKQQAKDIGDGLKKLTDLLSRPGALAACQTSGSYPVSTKTGCSA